MSDWYGSSGDCRNTLSSYLPNTHPAYKGEAQIPGALIEAGRKAAYALINAKLEVALPSKVPWASGSEPDLIYQISNDLTLCHVYKSKNPGPAPINKDIKATYCTDPAKLLDSIASLDMQLPETGDPIGVRVFHTHKDRHPIFDIDSELSQGPDSERLDDISDERDT